MAASKGVDRSSLAVRRARALVLGGDIPGALDAAPEALAYVESGRAAGKVVVEA